MSCKSLGLNHPQKKVFFSYSHETLIFYDFGPLSFILQDKNYVKHISNLNPENNRMNKGK